MNQEQQAAYSQTMQAMRGVVADLNHLQRCIERGETVEQIQQRLTTIVDVTASNTTRAGCSLYQAMQSAQVPAAPSCAELDESPSGARVLRIAVKFPNTAE